NNTPELIDSNVDWIYYDDDKEEDKMMGVSYIKEDYMYFSIKDKIIKTAHLDIEYDDSEAELELEIQNEDDYFIEPINHTFYYQDENGEGRKLDLLTGDEDSFDRSLLEGYTKSEHIHTENENSLQTDDALSLMKEARQETFIPGSAQSFFECNGEVYIYEETDIESGVGILYNYSDDFHTIDENVEGNSIEITKNAVFYKTQIDNKSSNYYQYNEDEDGEEAIQSTVGDNLEDFNDTNIYITQSEFEVNGEVETYIDGEQEEPSFEASKVFSKIGDDYVYTFGKTDIEGTTQDLYVGRKKIASNVTEVKAKNNKISTQ
ncbi:MAG: hypothetical protein KBT36_14190, partial [Kurthia sp.]|nr:hypothetical protein [Candidatus Kurthia equi]